MTIRATLGDIHITLLPKQAPLAAESSIIDAQRGCFKGTTLHRVIPKFVVRTGGTLGDGAGGRKDLGERV